MRNSARICGLGKVRRVMPRCDAGVADKILDKMGVLALSQEQYPSSMKKVHVSRAGMSRRKFIGTASSVVAGLSVVPRHVLGGPSFVAPSEKINVAIIGCGGQGQSNVRALFQHKDAQ